MERRGEAREKGARRQVEGRTSRSAWCQPPSHRPRALGLRTSSRTKKTKTKTNQNKTKPTLSQWSVRPCMAWSEDGISEVR